MKEKLIISWDSCWQIRYENSVLEHVIDIFAIKKNFDASIENYRKAMETAEKTGINELKEFSKAGLAISIGLKNINTEISEFQKKYQTGGSRR